MNESGENLYFVIANKFKTRKKKLPMETEEYFLSESKGPNSMQQNILETLIKTKLIEIFLDKNDELHKKVLLKIFFYK